MARRSDPTANSELSVLAACRALSRQVGTALRSRSATVATAESCTGGLVGALLTAVPGSSAYFLGGVIGYSNDSKTILLGVAPDTLARHGAVSAPTARQMAAGVRRRLGADIGVSVTGIAGPSGGRPGKPVGLVYIGLATASGEAAFGHQFAGGRDAVRSASAAAALQAVLKALDGLE